MVLGLSVVEMCRCGHPKLAHLHLRRGTDCSLCDESCGRFRPDPSPFPLRRALARVRSALHERF